MEGKLQIRTTVTCAASQICFVTCSNDLQHYWLLRGRLFGYHAESPGGLSRFRQHAWQLRKTCYNCLFMNGNLPVFPVYTGMVGRWQVSLLRAISSRAITQYVTRQKYFSHSSLVIYVWATLSSSQFIFTTLLSATGTTVFPAPFTSHCRLCNYDAPKLFWHLSQYVYFLTFLHPILLCRIT